MKCLNLAGIGYLEAIHEAKKTPSKIKHFGSLVLLGAFGVNKTTRERIIDFFEKIQGFVFSQSGGSNYFVLDFV